MSNAALDLQTGIDQVDLISGMEELQRCLEVLPGAKPEASVDELQKPHTEHQAGLVLKENR